MKRRIPNDVLMALGLGTGINNIAPAKLRQLWAEWGAAVTVYWQRYHGKPPFCATLAEREGWNGRKAH